MEISEEIDEVILFESELGEDKQRETNIDCIASFFHTDRTKPMKVIKL